METIFGKALIGSHGYYRITSPKKDKYDHKLLHRLIFERFYGKIPKGYHIHHIDENKLNNCIFNLKLVSHSEHITLHNKGKKQSFESRENSSKAKLGKSNSSNSSGYYRVYKYYHKQYAQGFTWVYEVDSSRLDGKKRIKTRIRRVNLKDLENAVKEAGYEWRKLGD